MEDFCFAAGFDLSRLIEHKRLGGSVVDCDQGESLAADDLIAIACDADISGSEATR